MVTSVNYFSTFNDTLEHFHEISISYLIPASQEDFIFVYLMALLGLKRVSLNKRDSKKLGLKLP
jgi:hypothetical protein